MLKKLSILFFFTILVSACGGGGGGGSTTPSNDPQPVSVSGGGVKGPLANADVNAYAFDPSQPGFKGALVGTGTTNASAALTGLTLPVPLNPPYILEFTSNASTIDLTTGMAPVIGTLRTVITQQLLDTGEQIYGTPLTTMATDIAVLNADSNVAPYTGNNDGTVTEEEFLNALNIAAQQVVSTLGFGMDSSIDIFDTPPLIDNTTDTTEEQTAVAQYRSAVEAMTAMVYHLGNDIANPPVSAEAMLTALTQDLSDGAIDASTGGAVDSNVTTELVTVDPATLPIPNTDDGTGNPLTVDAVEQILVDETADTGSTTPTDDLANQTITVTTQPAVSEPDIDGDTVPDSSDAFPTDPTETADSDGDTVGDNSDNCPAVANTNQENTDGDAEGNACDADDDNDGLTDAEEASLGTNPLLVDTDGDNVNDPVDLFPTNSQEWADQDSDNVGDNGDNCPANANTDQADTDGDGIGDVCDPVNDVDVDGDGINIPGDNCPGVANVDQTDTDNDGQGDACDADDDNDGVADASDNAALNPMSCADSDGDSCDDCSVGTDGFGPLADNLPNNDGLDTDADGACNVGDTDDDNDGLSDAAEPGVGTNPLIADTDGDGALDGSDNCPTTANDQTDTDGDGQGNACDADDDNDGVADGLDVAALNPLSCADTDGDSCDDCSVGADGFGPLADNMPNNDGLDTDSDGACNVGDTDDDNDNLTDEQEAALGTNPLLQDTDNDGANDDVDVCPLDPSTSTDPNVCATTSSGDTEAMLTAGFSTFEADNNWNDTLNRDVTDYRYENISWNSVSGAISSSEFIYNFATSTWDTFSSTEQNVVLTATGWTPYAAGTDSVEITMNPDGSARFSASVNNEVYEQFDITATQVDVSGTSILDSLSINDSDFISTINPPNASFSASASAYNIALTSQQVGYYMWCGDAPDSIGDYCNHVFADDGSGTGSTTEAVSLNDLLVSSSQLGSGYEWTYTQWVGESATHWYVVEFIGTDASAGQSGTANYLAQSKTSYQWSLAGTGTWNSTVLNTETLLTFDIPPQILSQLTDFDDDSDFFTVFDEGNGPYVRRGTAENFTNGALWRVYNAVARDDILNNFMAPDADGDGVADSIDNCLIVPNADQADADGNGIGDVCDPNADPDGDGVFNYADNCPTVANSDQADADSDGIGDACDSNSGVTNLMSFTTQDSDGDGVPDSVDAFPNDASEQFDSNNDGVGDNNAASTDDDGDGIPDGTDSCPKIADASNDPAACDNSTIIGAHQINWLVTDLVVTSEPEAGWCADGDVVNVTGGTEYIPFLDGGFGTIELGYDGDQRVYYNGLTGHMTFTDTYTEDRWVDSYGSFVTVSYVETIDLTYNSAANSWSGSYTETVTGPGVDCSRTETLSGSRIYQPNGSENYNSVYGFEARSEKWNDDTQQDIISREAAVGQFEFNPVAGTVVFHGNGYPDVLETSYDPGSGAFRYVTKRDELRDDNGDGQTDLLHRVEVIQGVLVNPDPADPDFYFESEAAKLVYLNTTTYNNQDPSYVDYEYDGQGYAKMLSTYMLNTSKTRTIGGGQYVNEDLLHLLNPPMELGSPDSQLYFETYNGPDTTSVQLCSVPFNDSFHERLHLPRPVFETGELNHSAYANVNCLLPAGTIAAGNSYTMVVRDDMGTPLDIGDDVERYNNVHVAVQRAAYPDVRINRRQIAINGAASSTTEAGERIPLSGYFNPYQDLTLTWSAAPPDAYGNSPTTYYVKMQEYDPVRGLEPRQTRIETSGTTATIPAHTLYDSSVVSMQLAVEYQDTNMDSVHAQSTDILFASGLNGMINVEMGPPLNAIFQLAITSHWESINCVVTTPQSGISCPSFTMWNAINWIDNTVTINMQDNSSGDMTGFPYNSFYLVLDFSGGNASSAVASINGNLGVARVVPTELTARTVIRANGNTSTQLSLSNPSPSYPGVVSSGSISSVSGSALDSVGSTVLSRWDDSVLDAGFWDTFGSFWQLPVEGVNVQRTGSFHNYDSHGFITNNGSVRQLADDRYVFNMSGNYGKLGNSRLFRVDYVYEDPSAYAGPGLTDITVNTTTAGAGVGNAAATPIDISGQTLIDLTWVSATDPAVTKWQVQIKKVIDPMVGNAVDNHVDIRSRRVLDSESTELSHDGADTYTWDNSQTMVDLADIIAPGEVARIVIRAENAESTIRGYGASIYVTIP